MIKQLVLHSVLTLVLTAAPPANPSILTLVCIRIKVGMQSEVKSMGFSFFFFSVMPSALSKSADLRERPRDEADEDKRE